MDGVRKHQGQKQSNHDLDDLYLQPSQPQFIPPEYEDSAHYSSKSHSKDDHLYSYESTSSDEDQFRPHSSKSNMSLVDSYSDDDDDDDDDYHYGVSKHSNPSQKHETVE